jgi:GT2 family glycosyltransferase
MRLAVVLVHYHAAELARAAIAALRADLAGTGVEAEWLLVDNGSDAAERELLAGQGVERLDPGENLGYAGGVNLGAARARADALLLMNPDVLVLPGCMPALLARLQAGAAVAGPRFFWDHGRRLLLPPAEPRRLRDELAAMLAARGERWAAQARRRWRRHARRHWRARAPLPSHALSGSLLAVRRDAWERAGPFDPAFRLYFEETDWLLRAARRGLRAEHVPAAEAVHLVGRSAAREPRAGAWFEESARRFRRRHYGAAFAWTLEALDRRLPRRAPAAPTAAPPDGLPQPCWVEVSPNPAGFPAAAERLETWSPGWTLPAEIRERMVGEPLVAQLTDAAGRELARWSLGVA